MEYKKIIKVPEYEINELQKFLYSDGEGEEKIIKRFIIPFDNNIEVEIKICDGDVSSPYIDTALYKNNPELIEFEELTCLETRIMLLGEYKLHYKNNTYIVVLEKE